MIGRQHLAGRAQSAPQQQQQLLHAHARDSRPNRCVCVCEVEVLVHLTNDSCRSKRAARRRGAIKSSGACRKPPEWACRPDLPAKLAAPIDSDLRVWSAQRAWLSVTMAGLPKEVTVTAENVWVAPKVPSPKTMDRTGSSGSSITSGSSRRASIVETRYCCVCGVHPGFGELVSAPGVEASCVQTLFADLCAAALPQ